MTTSTVAAIRPQSGPISPTPPQPVLDAGVVLPLGQGVVAAYAAFNGKSYSVPSGWTQVDSLTAWVPQEGGAAEAFGLWFTADGDSSTAMLALRGTVTAADTRADEEYATTTFVPYSGSVSPVPKVHGGFWSIYTGTSSTVPTSMQAQVFAWLAANNITTLYVTGHSLGGGLAEFLALDLAVGNPSLSATTVTFAAPKAGLSDSWGTAYAQYVTNPTTVRVVNQYDVVPTLPPGLRYTQVGEEFDVLFYNTLGDTSTQEATIRHEMDNYLAVLTQALATSTPPQVFVGTFPDGVYTDSSGNPLQDTSEAPTADNVARAKASAQALPLRPVAQPPRRQVAVK
ncbi:lipase family protein [Corallococcus praedator]|uniref:Lipase family protein n=1 Tax=Corallococcus praedator TaxID=2316724 RepID=A0ABX9QKD3_9BACT|nr:MULTISPECIES: lipase family protein [Corallococcus]RKH31653.1 lipase family protein [Corallococcus sp. CA031C]RKI10719.1 lipase family protein [Corallococcus praedator]